MYDSPDGPTPNAAKRYVDRPSWLVSCGGCRACKVRRSGDWMLRCTHEATLHERNAFITLTYADDWLPEAGGLEMLDLQSFWRRCRKRLVYDRPFERLRYFACGEYGDPRKGARPHYHACVFGQDFQPWLELENRSTHTVYTSELLDELWGMGRVTVSNFTPETAAYVAKYTFKKVTGDLAEEQDPRTGLRHYERLLEETGEVVEVAPEFITMSRRPGIGAKWIEQYHDDVYPRDHVVHDGRKFRPPVFYDRSLPEDELAALKLRRVAEADETHNDLDRAEARDQILRSREKLFSPRDRN